MTADSVAGDDGAAGRERVGCEGISLKVEPSLSKKPEDGVGLPHELFASPELDKVFRLMVVKRSVQLEAMPVCRRKGNGRAGSRVRLPKP